MARHSAHARKPHLRLTTLMKSCVFSIVLSSDNCYPVFNPNRCFLHPGRLPKIWKNVEPEKPSDDTNQLTRTRSLKYKQLVRSQAIRESQSPPRTVSPSAAVDVVKSDVTPPEMDDVVAHVKETTGVDNNECDKKSCEGGGDDCDKEECEDKKQPVEIQITGGGSDVEESEQRQRTRRWLGQKQHSDPRDLLSNNPRVACVCGALRRLSALQGSPAQGLPCADGYPKSESVEVEQQVYYCRCPDRREKPRQPTSHMHLTRTDSDEKMEPTGPELVAFLKETLNKNARDRATLLKVERELHALVADPGRTVVRFPVMTSYGRMLVHRCAALFQLYHNTDQTNRTAVLVSKSGTSGGRVPCTAFRQWCTASFPPASPLRAPAQPAQPAQTAQPAQPAAHNAKSVRHTHTPHHT
ncbi:hypothetical protein ACJJTC_014575 [Scirpophaga incertulas]